MHNVGKGGCVWVRPGLLDGARAVGRAAHGEPAADVEHGIRAVAAQRRHDVSDARVHRFARKRVFVQQDVRRRVLICGDVCAHCAPTRGTRGADDGTPERAGPTNNERRS